LSQEKLLLEKYEAYASTLLCSESQSAFLSFPSTVQHDGKGTQNVCVRTNGWKKGENERRQLGGHKSLFQLAQQEKPLSA
jgi:hypothetical protein